MTIEQHIAPVASKDILQSGKRFSLATTVMDDMKLNSHRINFILKYLDPKQYRALSQLRDAVNKKYAFTKALDAIDPLLMEGRAIMWNRQTPLHPDSADPVTAWVGMQVLGRFRKGCLWIPRLQLRLLYEPGAIIFLRGHILPHEVEAWEGGQRVSIVFFTHQSLWDEFGMSCP
jgi:hypothetical protein